MKPGRHVAVVLLAGIVVGITACSSSEPDTSAVDGGTTQAQTVTSAGPASTVRHVNAKAFADAMNQQGTVLLDVRTPAEFAAGHIARAKNIDAQANDFTKRLASLDKSAAYAIYCHTGRRSAVAAEQMRAAGFTKVTDLSGGLVAWTAAGNEVTTG